MSIDIIDTELGEQRKKSAGMTTEDQYQIHFCPGGIWCGVVTAGGAKTLRSGVKSVMSAIAAC